MKYEVRDDKGIALLCKFRGKVMTVYTKSNLYTPSFYYEPMELQLTENEINSYDERFMAFAVPVEEEEE